MGIIPDEIKQDILKACLLHNRAVSDPAQCQEFSRLMSDILSKLEDNQCYDAADKVMSILLNCVPKTGAHCDKSTIVGQSIEKFAQKLKSP